MLASYVHENVERDTAVQALLRLPTEHWLPDRVDDLAQNVLEHLQGADPTERSRPEFRSAHQLGRKLASLLPAEQRRRILNTLNTLGIRFVTIRSVPYSMRYDLVHVVAPAGGAVELKFENPDMWPHNLVIVAPGALEEIGIMASQMVPDSESWKGRRYVPKSDKVLYATRIVETSDSETMTIVAPEVVGEYPFLCTYPGHWVSMNGILHVVEDVDAWIAENPVKATGSDPDARAFVQAWKLEDLSDDLIKLEGRRSLERGKALFTVASCVACHRVGQVGGTLGPELDEVSRRLSPADMLAEILSPSKTINERYRISVIHLDDGGIVSGMIAKQDAEVIHLVEDAQATDETTKIARNRIAKMTPSEVSTMPMGLLNALTRDEILDLLAYIRSGVGPAP